MILLVSIVELIIILKLKLFVQAFFLQQFLLTMYVKIYSFKKTLTGGTSKTALPPRFSVETIAAIESGIPVLKHHDKIVNSVHIQ